jgi:hydrogenase maturation protease
MGNPILRDDRIGLRVLEELEGFFFDSNVSLQTSTLAGISLFETLVGFDRAIIVDAIQTGGEPGSVYRLTPEHFVIRHASPHLHNIDFFQTLALAGNLIPNMPKDVVILGIEVEDVLNFGENLTPAVESSIPAAIEQILEILKEGHETAISKEPPTRACPQSESQNPVEEDWRCGKP